MPMELIELYNLKGIPEDLKESIEQANIEIFDYGAVTYVTKAKIEYLINIYFKHLQKLIKDTE